MTDHDDPTPPPDEPLPEQVRARLRADLLAAAQADRPSGARRWLVPAVAAAAVLTVVGVAGWAVRAGGGDEDGAPVVAPSSSGVPDADWTMGWTDDPEPSEPTGKATLNLSTCVDPVGRVLAGAQQVATFPADDDGGETTIWVAGESFVLCDVRAGTTTVHKAGSLAGEAGVAPYQVSSIYPRTPDGFRTVQVAGGPVPAGALAFDVSYAFPDGQVEAATTTTDDEGRTWWRVVHGYDAEPGRTPIEVTVSYSGAQQTYSLRPGVDTCAQADTDC